VDDLELILTMLSEQTTTEIHRKKDSQGLPRLEDDAKAGGKIAGDNFLSKKDKKQLEG